MAILPNQEGTLQIGWNGSANCLPGLHQYVVGYLLCEDHSLNRIFACEAGFAGLGDSRPAPQVLLRSAVKGVGRNVKAVRQFICQRSKDSVATHLLN